MFPLYHSEGCNICETVFRECYANDFYTTTCSGVRGHRMQAIKHTIISHLDRRGWPRGVNGACVVGKELMVGEIANGEERANWEKGCIWEKGASLN